MHHHLNTLYQGQSLSRESTRDAFGQVVRGEVDPIVLASLLTALKIKGETPEEIAGAAEALLAEARDFPRPDYEFCDIVGTGGDGLNTINVSTTSALVAAACGLKVAKHGNRSVSSKSGSSDLLDKMGIRLDEIAIHGPTQVAQIRDGEIREFLLTPADFGLETYPVSAIQGGEPEENRAITAAILEGRGTPAHNAAIAANVAPLLLMAGKAKDLKSAAAQVLAVLASGKTAELAARLATLSHQEA